jgi:hypothetical protein
VQNTKAQQPIINQPTLLEPNKCGQKITYFLKKRKSFQEKKKANSGHGNVLVTPAKKLPSDGDKKLLSANKNIAVNKQLILLIFS